MNANKMLMVIGVAVCLCLFCNVFAQGKKAPVLHDIPSHRSVLNARNKLVARYIAKLKKVPSDAYLLQSRAHYARRISMLKKVPWDTGPLPDIAHYHVLDTARVLGEYRAKEAVPELLRLISVRLCGLGPLTGGSPQTEYPAVGALIEIGMPSVLAIRDTIENPKMVLDKKQVIYLYTFIIYSVIGQDHIKAWLLEEKSHCPKGAEKNYDKFLATDTVKRCAGPEYRREPTTKPALSSPTTQCAK